MNRILNLKSITKLLGVGLLFLGQSTLCAFTDKPIVEIDYDGNSLAVWQCNTPEGSCIQASISSQSCPTQWSPPKLISHPLENADSPVLAINERGDAVIIWRAIRINPTTPRTSTPEELEYRPAPYTDYYLAAALYRIEDGEWFGPKIISSPNERILPNYTVKINLWNQITVIWNSFPDCDCTEAVVRTAKRNAWATPGTWSQPVTISD